MADNTGGIFGGLNWSPLGWDAEPQGTGQGAPPLRVSVGGDMPPPSVASGMAPGQPAWVPTGNPAFPGQNPLDPGNELPGTPGASRPNTMWDTGPTIQEKLFPGLGGGSSTGAGVSIWDKLSDYFLRGIVVVLGLVFIAAGLYMFNDPNASIVAALKKTGKV